MAEENKRRQLIDVDEFEAEARRIAAVVGIKDDEVRFSLNDMIRNVKHLVKPTNDWRVGIPPVNGGYRHYIVSYLLKSGKVIVFEAVYSSGFGWESLKTDHSFNPRKVIAWQPLPDGYDYKICRHCKHHISNFIIGDYCTHSGTRTIADHTCDDWEEKTREEADPADQENERRR